MTNKLTSYQRDKWIDFCRHCYLLYILCWQDRFYKFNNHYLFNYVLLNSFHIMSTVVRDIIFLFFFILLAEVIVQNVNLEAYYAKMYFKSTLKYTQSCCTIEHFTTWRWILWLYKRVSQIVCTLPEVMIQIFIMCNTLVN